MLTRKSRHQNELNDVDVESFHKVDTTQCDSGDVVLAVDIWINKDKLEVKLLSKDYPEIQYPLYLGASAAQNGGIELIKGIKLL